jgi:hypothetical protein
MEKKTIQKSDAVKTAKIDPNFKAPVGKGTNGNSQIRLITTDQAGKLPAQAGKIVEALVKAKGHTLTVQELVGENESGLNSKLDEVGLITVQTPRKIWQFYNRRLIDEGFIEVIS